MENKKIIYVVKNKLHNVPPCISQIVMLCELGCSVCVIAEKCDETALNIISAAGAKICIIGKENEPKGYFERAWRWISFAKNAKREIKKVYEKNDIIWAGTEDVTIALRGFLKNKPFVFVMLELYDHFFTPQFNMKKFSLGRLKEKIALTIRKYGIKKSINKALAVIACEQNRARLMKLWYDLDEIPYIMHNKPSYEIVTKKSEEVEKFSLKLKDKRYILYQGILSDDRSLNTLAEALKKTKEKYSLVVIGKSFQNNEEYVLNKLRNIYDNIYYGGFFPAPQHLHITEGAYIGVAFYDSSSLNNMFCAPNKIFEYSKFNVPILGNDIPGLQCTVEKNGAGICVDMENPDEIAKAIDKISENYEEYQKGAERLYNSVDNLKVMKEIVEKIQKS